MKNVVLSRFISDYGSVFVLLILCAYYSAVTLSEQHPITPKAGRQVARAIVEQVGDGAAVVIVVRKTVQDQAFAEAMRQELESRGGRVVGTLAGQPSEIRKGLEEIAARESRIDAIATHHPGSELGPLQPQTLARLADRFPAMKATRVFKPASYRWPSFLTRDNLLNVINQKADVAIIAIGMTLVIITGGIDLSVGSLLALAGVTTAVVVHRWAGGAQAGVAGLLGAALVGIGLCALCGAFSGVMVTFFRVPAFVVTLSLMKVIRGLALIIAVRHGAMLAGGTTEGTPEAVKIPSELFGWLGNGQMLGIPNPILLMVLLYAVAHVAMTRTSFGRYVYAVGGNAEAARLSGVPVFGVLILVYVICGAMAGLGGIVDASRFEGGRPNAGESYELEVIAAVVVGGTSLAGGEGRIIGTLIGALIIAVIKNGLNMAGVQPYEQMVVFGLLILAAVLLDQLKKRSWKRFRFRRRIVSEAAERKWPNSET